MPDTASLTVPEAAQAAAWQTFSAQCASCHGGDGRGQTALGLGLTPPPPDFHRWALTPQRAFDVITGGYPSTAMVAFSSLSEDERWGLVKIMDGFRQE